MKIALSVWNGRISPVFDVSRHLMLFEVEAGKVVATFEEIFSSDNPFQKVRRLADIDVDVLICGAVSQTVDTMLENKGIERIAFIAGDIDDVISAYLADTLPNADMTMPGCGSRRRRRRRWRNNV
ncbi:MAG: NifB/NifX family molybdenum-iron cluster-binding protein [Thermodesulfobacteriota bacterium]